MKLGRPPKKTRLQKSEEIRDSLFNAAAEIVGEIGYRDCSISRIAMRANVAQGTFYNYFNSRQDLFDELLPVLGAKMMAHIRAEVSGSGSFIEREERSFRAFFNFLRRMPYFLRILNESELFAPKAYKRHFSAIVDGYIRFLRSSRDRGETSSLSDKEIEAVAYMLISTRGSLAARYLNSDGTVDLPEEAVNAYIKLVANGIATAPGP